VTLVERASGLIPRSCRELAGRHAELLKFLVVGGSTWFIDTGIFLVLKSTVLEPKPVTAKVISTAVATVISYVLNRDWSFRRRGGRQRHHEALLYALISAAGVAVYAAPLWLSRYALDLRTPMVSPFAENLADFLSGQVVGVLAGMAFRWWAFRQFVFPTVRPEDDPIPSPRRGDRPDRPGPPERTRQGELTRQSETEVHR
jgi:putative flippase GtrA